MQKRRHRTMLVGSMLLAVVVMGAWFPASDLLHQHQQLAAATTELRHLDQKNHALKEKAAQLETPAAIGRIAQQQYDLVAPGEQAYQVLPASGSGNGTVSGHTPGTLAAGTTPAIGTATTGAPTDGGRSLASGGHGATATRSGATAKATSAATANRAAGGFFSRIVDTLEFWR